MVRFLLRRVAMALPTLFFISIVSFVIIQLPPGDYLTTYVTQLEMTGEHVDQSEIDALKARYGLGQPIYVQYLKWMVRLFQGDFGYSFEWEQPVKDLVGERIALTLAVSGASLLFSWIIAFPIGIYSAVRQHTPADYIFTFIGFIGLSIPNFMLALIIMYLAMQYLGLSVGGLFSPDFVNAPWTVGKLLDLLKHIWVPMIIVGTAGTAGLIRILRNNLLDELRKQYVTTARAKGLAEIKVVFKYPVRVALIPFVSVVGWQLPRLISGAMVTAVVLNLPTTGPFLLRALMSQDMYLAGTLIFFVAVLTVIGTLISDILLVVADPRIRYE